MTDAAIGPVTEALRELARAEQQGMLRLMGEGSPHWTRADAGLRAALARMLRSSDRRLGELAELLEPMGEDLPRVLSGHEQQYLAYLSMRFLLPKLIVEKREMVERYDRVIMTIGESAMSAVVRTLQAQREELSNEAQVLEASSLPRRAAG